MVLRPPASKAVTKSLKGNRSDEIPSNLSLVLTEKLEILKNKSFLMINKTGFLKAFP